MDQIGKTGQADRKTRIRLGLQLIFSLLVLITSFWLLADFGQPSEGFNDGEAVPRVQVAQVEETQEMRPLRLSGVTRAARRAEMAFVVSGRLVERKKRSGERVRAGEILARLESPGVQAKVDEAEAALAEIDARLQRGLDHECQITSLVEDQAATEEELAMAITEVKALTAAKASAVARLESARQGRREAVLVAPFDAVVSDVLAEPGEVVAAGRSILRLSGLGEVEIEVEIPESRLALLAEEGALDVHFPLLPALQAVGSLRRVPTVGLGPGRLFPVVIALEPAPGLRPGLTAEVEWRLSSASVLTVPIEAVIDPVGERTSLFRVRGERVERVVIEVGRVLGDRVSISTVPGLTNQRVDALPSEPLRVNDLVVTRGHGDLIDGLAVEVGR